MKNEMHLSETELETLAGGIQDLTISGSVDQLIDNSVNNSFNTKTVTKVDASTKISDSFNSTKFLGSLFPF